MSRMTNVELVTELMELSPFGALSQIFIMQAISEYAKVVSQTNPEEIDSPMISGQAWVGVAKDIKARLEQHLR